MQDYTISPNIPLGHTQSAVFIAVNPVLDKTTVKRIFTHCPEQLQTDFDATLELPGKHLLIPEKLLEYSGTEHYMVIDLATNDLY